MSKAATHVTGLQSVTTAVQTASAGSTLLATGVGTLMLPVQDIRGRTRQLKLARTLVAPGLTCELLAVGSLVDAGYTVYFSPTRSGIMLTDDSSDFIPFVRDRHLWYIDEVQPPDLAAVARPPAKLSSTELWHLRLGHISPAYLRHMKLPDLPQVRAFTCHTCQEAKMRHASKAGPSSSRASQPFELIHADTAGTTHHKSIHGESWRGILYSLLL